jgi:hypothetical protein
MNDTLDGGRIRRDELDREIETIRTERLIRAATPDQPGLPSRARAGLGRRLISVGTALLGSSERAARTAPSTSAR